MPEPSEKLLLQDTAWDLAVDALLAALYREGMTPVDPESGEDSTNDLAQTLASDVIPYVLAGHEASRDRLEARVRELVEQWEAEAERIEIAEGVRGREMRAGYLDGLGGCIDEIRAFLPPVGASPDTEGERNDG